MIKKNGHIGLLIFLLLSIRMINAQAYRQTNMGTVFYFAYGQNPSGELFFQVTATKNTRIWVQTHQDTAEYFVSAAIPQTFQLPRNMMTQADQIENKGICIRSEENISIIASNIRTHTTDATLILPLNALGFAYSANRYHLSNVGIGVRDNKIMVVATSPNTQVDFINIYTNEVIESVELDLLQTYTYDYQNNQSNIKVVAPNQEHISVFYTNDCTIVGSCAACDHLFTQLMADAMLGQRYVALPILQQSAGYILSIMAVEDSTTLYINHRAPISINKGQIYELDVITPEITQIESNSKISILQLLKGQNCHTPKIGDPACVQLSAVEQITFESYFTTLVSPIITEQHIIVLIRKDAKHLLKINGQPAPLSNFQDLDLFNEFSFYTQRITAGANRIECELGFIGYLYGLGSAESYLSLLGASFVPLLSPSFDYPAEVCVNDTAFIILKDLSVFPNFNLDSSWTFINDSMAYKVHNQTGTYRYNYYVKTDEQNYEYTFYIQVNPLPHLELQDTQVCINEQHRLTAFADSSFKSHIWVDPNGDSLFLASIPIQNAGKYTLISESTKGCINSDSLKVTFLQNTPFTLNKSYVCAGDLKELILVHPDTAAPYSHAVWQFSNGTRLEGIEPTYRFTQTGIWDVRVTTVNTLGCKDTVYKSEFLQVIERPVAQIQAEPIRDSMGLVLYHLSSAQTNGEQCLWRFNNSEERHGPAMRYAFRTLGKNAVYLRVENAWGCADSTEINLHVESLYKIWIPNSFSPNQDGNNEVFLPYGLDFAQDYNLEIYNRWGELVFKSNDIQTGWDGNASGRAMPDGVYVYIIDITDPYNHPTQYRGTIHLKR